MALTFAQTVKKIKRAFSSSDRDAFYQMYKSLASFRAARVNVNPGNIVGGAELDVVVALPVASFGTVKAATHLLDVYPPDTLEAGIYIRRGWISADNQATITLRNETAGAVDPAAADWIFETKSPLDLSNLL
jgi:hypothetical protein